MTLPYLPAPTLHIGPLVLPAFDLLAVAAAASGCAIVVQRAARLGWERERALNLTLWMVLCGGVGSHVFAMLAYQPELVRTNPLVLLRVWGAMSSFGGIAGGLIGGLITARRMKLSRADIYRYFDIVAFAFPFAWIFGRAGCALVHDHLGIASSSFFAVEFPGGPRLDLGLLELIYTVALAALFLWLDQMPRRSGYFLGLFFALYGPVRFALDELRTGDIRYWGWTPGQFAAFGTTFLGLACLIAIKRDPRSDA